MESLKSNYRRAVLLWIVMVGGIFVYLSVVESFKSDASFLRKGAFSPEVMPIKFLLLIFTGMTPLLIWFVRHRVLWGKAPEAFKNPAFRLLICSLATYLLCETVAITGLTLFFLTGSTLSFYLFMVLSLTLFAYFFPRYSEWKEWNAKVAGVEKPVDCPHPSLLQMPELH